MAIVLTSDFPSTPNPEVVACMVSTRRKPRVAWMAPEASSRYVRFPAAQKRFRDFGVEHLEFVDVTRHAALGPDPLSAFDVVYLTGGNPLHFRDAIAGAGLGHHLRVFADNGGVIVGASGGAMQLTRNVSLYRLLHSTADEVISTRAGFDAVGLVDCEVLPHYNRHTADFLDRVRRYSGSIEHEIIALADGAAMIQSRGSEPRFVGSAWRYDAGRLNDL